MIPLNKYTAEIKNDINFNNKPSKEQNGAESTQTQEKDANEKTQQGRIPLFPLREEISLGSIMY